MFESTPSPVSEAPQQPEPVSTSTPMPVRRKSRVGAVIMIVLLLILVLVGAAGAYYFFVFRQNPEYVLGKSMLAMSEVQSSAFDVELKLSGQLQDTKDDDVANIAITLQALGEAEFAKGGDFFTTASVQVEAEGAEADAPFGPFSGEVRQSDAVLYLNLATFTIPNFFPGVDMASIVSVVTDRWIEIDTKEIVDMLGVGEFVNKIEDKQAEQEEKYADRIEEAAREYLPTFFTITENLGRDEVDGATTHHFAYVVNEDAMRGFFGRVQEIVSEDLGEAANGEIDDVNAFLDGVENLHGEMWIGTADSYLHKITLLGTAVRPEGKEDEEPIQLQLTVMLSKFNEPVVVEVPEQVTPVQDVVGEIMTAVTEAAAAGKAALESDEDADGLSLAKEDRCGTDPKNPDTDGDGFTDGDEVAGGYNPNGAGEIVWPGSMRMENNCPRISRLEN